MDHAVPSADGQSGHCCGLAGRGAWQEAKKGFLGESFTNSVCFKTQLIDTFLKFETTLA